jgi:hypothetical protein
LITGGIGVWDAVHAGSGRDVLAGAPHIAATQLFFIA